MPPSQRSLIQVEPQNSSGEHGVRDPPRPVVAPSGLAWGLEVEPSPDCAPWDWTDPDFPSNLGRPLGGAAVTAGPALRGLASSCAPSPRCAPRTPPRLSAA